MKKALVVLLILAVAGGVFAQELKFSGLVDSGLVLNMQEDANDDLQATLKAYAWDAGQNLYRFRLNGSYTMENMGVNFRLHAQGGNNVFMEFGYGFVNLFNKMVNIKGGLVDDGTWNSMGDIDGDVGEGTGTLIMAKPIDGLSVGVGIYIASKNDAAGSDAIDATYTMGAAYAMPDLFKFTINAKFLGNEADKPDAGSFQRLMGGLSILAVPNLTAIVEYVIDNKENSAGGLINGKDTPFEFTEKLAYKIDAFTVGVTAYEFFNGILHTQDKHNPLRNNYGGRGLLTAEQLKDLFVFYKSGFYVEPWVSYALLEGKVTPKLGVKFSMHNFEDTSYGDGNMTELRIKPEVRFALASNSWIDLAYEFHNQMYGGDFDDADSVILNRIYVDYVWKF